MQCQKGSLDVEAFFIILDKLHYRYVVISAENSCQESTVFLAKKEDSHSRIVIRSIASCCKDHVRLECCVPFVFGCVFGGGIAAGTLCRLARCNQGAGRQLHDAMKFKRLKMFATCYIFFYQSRILSTFHRLIVRKHLVLFSQGDFTMVCKKSTSATATRTVKI